MTKNVDDKKFTSLFYRWSKEEEIMGPYRDEYLFEAELKTATARCKYDNVSKLKDAIKTICMDRAKEGFSNAFIDRDTLTRQGITTRAISVDDVVNQISILKLCHFFKSDCGPTAYHWCIVVKWDK